MNQPLPTQMHMPPPTDGGQIAPQPMPAPVAPMPVAAPTVAPAPALPTAHAPAPAMPVAQPMPNPAPPIATPPQVGMPQIQPGQAPMQAAQPHVPVAAPAPMPAGGVPQATGVPIQAAPPPMAVSPVPDLEEMGLGREGGEKALPKISIHAFCDRQETAGVINEATRDWRMKRTNVKIYMGGLLAAIEYYHKENTPSLILIETGMRGAELFAQLEQLASVCDAGTKVVVIGAANDIKLYRQLMDQGVSDYLVPPFHPINLIRSMGDLFSDPEKPFSGRVISFFGAKGGVGSSTIAHNVAWCLSEVIRQETALVDMDASWGTTGLDFAYDSSSGLEEALGQTDRLDETLLDRIMIRHSTCLSLLPASGSLNSKPTFTPEAYEAVVDGVRSLSPVTILDLPHYWCDWTTRVLTNSDDIVVTATPDLANLRNTKNLIDFFRAQRPNDGDPILILNKTGMSKNSEISVKDFGAAVGMEPALVLGFDPESFFEAANEGKMLTDVKSAAQAMSGIDFIARRVKTGRFEDISSLQVNGKGAGKRKNKAKTKADKAAKKAAKGKGKSLFSFKGKGK